MAGFNLFNFIMLLGTCCFCMALPHRDPYASSSHTYRANSSSDPMLGNTSFHEDPTRQMNQKVVDSDHKSQGIYCLKVDYDKDRRRVWLMDNKATEKCCKSSSGNCVAISFQGKHYTHFEYDYYCLVRTDEQRRKFQDYCSQDRMHSEIQTPARVDLPCPQY